jgi:hypothetical protein
MKKKNLYHGVLYLNRLLYIIKSFEQERKTLIWWIEDPSFGRI